MNMFDKSSTKKDVDQKKRKQTNGSLTQKANGSMIIELENDGNQVETNGNNETIIEDKPDEDDEESTQKLRQEIAKLRQLNFHLYQSSMDKLMNESVHKFDALWCVWNKLHVLFIFLMWINTMYKTIGYKQSKIGPMLRFPTQIGGARRYWIHFQTVPSVQVEGKSENCNRFE